MEQRFKIKRKEWIKCAGAMMLSAAMVLSNSSFVALAEDDAGLTVDMSVNEETLAETGNEAETFAPETAKALQEEYSDDSEVLLEEDQNPVLIESSEWKESGDTVFGDDAEDGTGELLLGVSEDAELVPVERDEDEPQEPTYRYDWKEIDDLLSGIKLVADFADIPTTVPLYVNEKQTPEDINIENITVADSDIITIEKKTEGGWNIYAAAPGSTTLFISYRSPFTDEIEQHSYTFHIVSLAGLYQGAELVIEGEGIGADSRDQDGWKEYDVPLAESTVRYQYAQVFDESGKDYFIVGETAYIGNTIDCLVVNGNHPSGAIVPAQVLDVQITEAQQKIEDSDIWMGADPAAVFDLKKEENEWGMPEGGWNLKAVDQGRAWITIDVQSLENPDETLQQKFELQVEGDRYKVEWQYPDGNDLMLTDGEMIVQAAVTQTYKDENGERLKKDVFDVSLEIAPDDTDTNTNVQAIVRDGNSIVVKAGSNAGEGYIPVTVKFTDSQKRAREMHEKMHYEIRKGYYFIEDKAEEPLESRQVDVDDEISLKEYTKMFALFHAEVENGKQEMPVGTEGIRYHLVQYDEENIDKTQETWNDPLPTLVRFGMKETGFTIVAEKESEDGSYRELCRKEFHLSALDYDITIEGPMSGDLNMEDDCLYVGKKQIIRVNIPDKMRANIRKWNVMDSRAYEYGLKLNYIFDSEGKRIEGVGTDLSNVRGEGFEYGFDYEVITGIKSGSDEIWVTPEGSWVKFIYSIDYTGGPMGDDGMRERIHHVWSGTKYFKLRNEEKAVVFDTSFLPGEEKTVPTTGWIDDEKHWGGALAQVTMDNVRWEDPQMWNEETQKYETAEMSAIAVLKTDADGNTSLRALGKGKVSMVVTWKDNAGAVFENRYVVTVDDERYELRPQEETISLVENQRKSHIAELDLKKIVKDGSETVTDPVIKLDPEKNGNGACHAKVLEDGQIEIIAGGKKGGCRLHVLAYLQEDDTEPCADAWITVNTDTCVHEWDETKIMPTCEADGVWNRSCKICTEEDRRNLFATGHKPEYVDETVSTCVEFGHIGHWKCNTCGQLFRDKDGQNKVVEQELRKPLVPHSLTYVPAIAATTEAEGHVEYWHCTECGQNFGDAQGIGILKQVAVPKMKPTTMTTNAIGDKILLKVGQSTTKFTVSGLAEGDSIVSMTLSKNKAVKMSSVNLAKGTCKLKATKKTGKAVLTVTLASGLKKNIQIKIQKKAVKTTRISGVEKTLRLKKGKSITLKPTVEPFTSKYKVKFVSKNKKIAKISKKGKLKAVKPGKTKIILTSGKKKFTVNVTVEK